MADSKTEVPQRIYEAQNRYIQKNRDADMTRVQVWVNKGRDAEEIRAIAKEMRDGTWFE